MDINEIAKKVRGREIKLFLPTKVLNPEERVAGLYVGLNIYLAKMMENVRNENRKELIEYFCETMVYFISIAKHFSIIRSTGVTLISTVSTIDGWIRTSSISS